LAHPQIAAWLQSNVEATMRYSGAIDASLVSRSSTRATQAIFESLTPARCVAGLIVLGTIIRVVLAGSVGFGTDESYTVANARQFALSYVDYPPLHVWLVGGWSWLWNTESPLILRLPFIASFAGSTWFMFRLTSLLFGERAGAWSALLLNLAPVFTLAHASWVLPDGPLMLLMLAGAYVAARLLFAPDEPSRELVGWLVAGSLAGLAMLTKYHGVFLPAAVFVFLLTWGPGRKLLATPGPWLAAAVALAVFLPVIAWNSTHDWTGLFFQTRRLSDAPHLSLFRVFNAVASQSAYLTPWLYIPLAAVWIAALAKGPSSPRTWFLGLLATGPIVVFTAANVVARGLPHWPMPGWLFAFPLLGCELALIVQTRPRLVYFSSAASAAVLLLAVSVFGTDGQSGWLANKLPRQMARQDPTLDLLNWTELNTDISQRHLIDTETPAMAATHWMEAGKLNYAVGRTVPVLCLCVDPQQFRYLHNPGEFAGRNIIVVGAHRNLTAQLLVLRAWFARTETLAPITLHRAGQPAIELTVVRGIGLRPLGQVSDGVATSAGQGNISMAGE
jgi:hypothetical protein